MSIEQGFYRIELPVAKLDTITADVKDRLFTKRSERKITYDGVSNDLDAFIETLQLSRSTTPGTASQGKAINISNSMKSLKVLRSLIQQVAVPVVLLRISLRSEMSLNRSCTTRSSTPRIRRPMKKNLPHRQHHPQNEEVPKKKRCLLL